jgi:hypothetical protein
VQYINTLHTEREVRQAIFNPVHPVSAARIGFESRRGPAWEGEIACHSHSCVRNAEQRKSHTSNDRISANMSRDRLMHLGPVNAAPLAMDYLQALHIIARFP